MGERFLIDTNVIIYLLNGLLPKHNLNQVQTIVETETNISIITRIEVLGYPFKSMEDMEKTESFVSKCFIFELDKLTSNEAIRIRKENHIKLPDAVIAATAIVNNFTLISRNKNDFSKIKGLKIINPFTL